MLRRQRILRRSLRRVPSAIKTQHKLEVLRLQLYRYIKAVNKIKCRVKATKVLTALIDTKTLIWVSHRRME